MSAAAFDPRIRAYFGDEVLRAGFVPLPHLFLRHYRKLGLSHLQALFVLQLMEIVWDLGDAPSSVARLAERLGVDRRTVQICSKELQEMGLLEIFDQWDQSGAQVENGYDLTALFRRLAAVDEQPAARTLVRRSRRTTNDERRTTNDGRPTTNDHGSLGPEPPTPNTQHPTPSTQHPTPNTQHPTPNTLSAIPHSPRSFDRTTLRSEDHTALRSKDHAGADVEIVAPLVPGSELKGKTKKKTKKQQESNKNTHQHTARVHRDATPTERPGSHGGGGTAKQTVDQKQILPAVTAHSLRWNIALSNDETAQSRTILERTGLHRHVAATAATTLHPAEAWTLRLYARAAQLSPAWIARQVYDFGTKQACAAPISAHYDEAGRLFAALELDAAEQLCDLVDRTCPAQAATVEHTVQAALGCDAAIGAALRAGWSLMAEQRRGPLHLPTATLPLSEATDVAVPSLWQRVLDRLEAHVAPEAFATWLGATILLEQEHNLVVIGTPNVFVRDEVAATYRTAIEEALKAELGQPVRIEIVIGGVAQVVP